MSDKVLDLTRPAATTDDEVVQHILSFLASSTWRSALESYLDEHCLVFSPAETNKLVYSAKMLFIQFYFFRYLVCADCFVAGCSVLSSSPTT